MALMFVSRFATNEPNRLCGTTESVQLLGPPLFRQVAQARHHRRRRQQSPSSGSRPVHSVTVPLALDHLRGGPKKWSSSVQIHTPEASFWPSFLRTCTVQLRRAAPKVGCNFFGDINRQDWARSGGRRVPVLDLENACQPASSSKNSSRH